VIQNLGGRIELDHVHGRRRSRYRPITKGVVERWMDGCAGAASLAAEAAAAFALCDPRGGRAEFSGLGDWGDSRLSVGCGVVCV
jgi:hypothetical protein